MTECQGCGAWNDTSRTLCVLCGTPLAETDEWDATAELPPLPPLPDGGLRASMPSWLWEPPVPIVTDTPPLAPLDTDVATDQVADLAPLGPRADPRTFLSDDDFPQWLRDLASRWEGTARRSAETAPQPVTADAAGRRTPSNWPDQSGSNASVAASASAGTHAEAAPPAEVLTVPEPDSAPGSAARTDEPPQAAVATRPLEERRGRGLWETLLLVLLSIGVIAAALWALVANGVLNPGL